MSAESRTTKLTPTPLSSPRGSGSRLIARSLNSQLNIYTKKTKGRSKSSTNAKGEDEGRKQPARNVPV
jgi:hypothetical protein